MSPQCLPGVHQVYVLINFGFSLITLAFIAGTSAQNSEGERDNSVLSLQPPLCPVRGLQPRHSEKGTPDPCLAPDSAVDRIPWLPCWG